MNALAAEAAGIARFYSEVNEISLPLFEREGFVVVGAETIARNGVRIDRYLVER